MSLCTRRLSGSTVHCFVFAASLVLHVTQVIAEDPARSDEVRVSPLDEITIIDAGVNSTGKPEPVITSNHQVDIPPALIIHNYYYSGDRDFRAPAFPGGPCVVVAQHPLTGEKMYLDVQMLPGSPRVVYRRHAIEYHFGSQRIQIQFFNPLDPLHLCEPIVKYCSGNETIQEPLSTTNRKGQVAAWLNRTGLPAAVSSAGKGTRNLAMRSADGIRRTGEMAVQPIQRLVNATPLGNLINEDDAQAATRERDRAVTESRRIAEQRDRFIPTLR